jgi:hypothetical protein
MFIFWAILGAVFGNVAFIVGGHIFPARDEYGCIVDNWERQLTFQGMFALTAVAIVCGIGFLLFPDARL